MSPISPRCLPSAASVIAFVIALCGVSCSGILHVQLDSPTFYLYVSSYSNGTISRIDPLTGSVSTILTGLFQPEGGVCDSRGRLYFAQPAIGRIIRFEQNGSNVVTIMSSSSLQPEGPSFSPSSDLFFTTRKGANGAAWKIGGGLPGGAMDQATASFTNFSEGTAFTKSGELLAVDTYGARVLKFTPPFGPSNQGSVVVSGMPYWNGITVATNGDLYVANASGGSILHFSPSGALLGTIRGMRYPAFLLFGPDGYLYATDFVYQPFPGQVDSVVRIAPDGSVRVLTYLLGSLGLAICSSGGSAPGPSTPLLLGEYLLLVGLLLGGFAAVAATIAWLLLRTTTSGRGYSFPRCSSCGARVDLQFAYCPNCGKQLAGRPPPAP